MTSARRYYRPGSRLWLALRFNDLPMEVLVLDDSSKPVVVIEQQRVIYVSESAYASGVRCGMDVTTARLLSDCEIHERDQQKEIEALNKLSAQLYQFTPYIESYHCEYV
ncbi:MAG: hypothetical protein EOP48_08975, partial [Sphingobacteriales bacterium]